MLNILYQDQWLAIVDKPAGMLVHPGREPEPRENIAMKVLRDQMGQKVYPVHRLDRPTSGALMFVLDEETVPYFRNQFDEQRVIKRYSAVVLGETLEHWVARSDLRKSEDEPFREAETHFTRKRTSTLGDETFSVLTAEPKTGRFHQIRKHLAGNGTPIVGDFLYGGIAQMERLAERIGQPRMMLHAGTLRFTHPVSRDWIEVESPLPDRFAPFE